MKIDKRNSYVLTGGIHTLEIKVKRDILVPKDKRPAWLENCVRNETVSKREPDVVKLVINPNRYNGDIYGIDLFEESLNTILEGLGIYCLDDFEINRADFRMDSFESEHYHAFSKLNRLLISMLAVTYKVRNCYRTCNLFTQQQLSIAIKNRDFEVENYDKNSESHGMDFAQSRLEQRSKRGLGYDLETEFLGRWRVRWERGIENIDAVYDRYNEELAKLYNQGKNSYPQRWLTHTDFVLHYQDCIFCRKQLIDLLKRMGVSEPEKKARNIKKNYKLEFFSKSDVQYAIKEILRSTQAFFNNEAVYVPAIRELLTA